jgi:ribonuclease HI
MSFREKLIKCINFIKSDEKLRTILAGIKDFQHAHVLDPLIQYDIMSTPTKYIICAPIYYEGAMSGLAYDHPKYYELLQLAFESDKFVSLNWLASQGILMINMRPTIDGLFDEFAQRIVEVIRERNPDIIEIVFDNIEELDLLIPKESKFVKDFNANIRDKTKDIVWRKLESPIISVFSNIRDDLFMQILRNVIKHKTKHFIIFTDGSAPKNGEIKCKTSWGFIPITPVFEGQKKCVGEETNYDKYDFIDISKKQTNNRAELLAIYEAFLFCLTKHDEWDIADEQKVILIITDSEYSKNTLMVLYDKWLKEKVLAGKENLDIVVQIKSIMGMLEQRGYKIFIEHTRGHLDPIVPLGSAESYIRHFNIMIDKFVGTFTS